MYATKPINKGKWLSETETIGCRDKESFLDEGGDGDVKSEIIYLNNNNRYSSGSDIIYYLI